MRRRARGWLRDLCWDRGLVTGRCPRARAACGFSRNLKCKGLETQEKKEKVLQKMDVSLPSVPSRNLFHGCNKAIVNGFLGQEVMTVLQPSEDARLRKAQGENLSETCPVCRASRGNWHACQEGWALACWR
ncbi:uncharacterized protein V3H86_008692 isoform 1-T1 [Mergus octosetaceus]